MDWNILTGPIRAGTRYCSREHSRGRIDLSIPPETPNVVEWSFVSHADIEEARRHLALAAHAPTSMLAANPKPKRRCKRAAAEPAKTRRQA